MYEGQENEFYLYDKKTLFPWLYIMDGPSWYNINTRGCCHPAGAILTGSTRDDGAKKIVLMKFDDRTIIELPDLKCSVANVGMVYDASTDVLTLAGGCNNNDGPWDTTSNVFQLRNLKTLLMNTYWDETKNVIALDDFSKDCVWDELEDLPSAVSDPVLVNDNEYLYVLGGSDSLQCARIPKGQKEGWKIMNCNLPYPCDGENHGGAFFINHTVTLISVSHMMELENTGYRPSWKVTRFNDNTIKQCIPMLYLRRIIGFLDRGSGDTVEIYESGTQRWKPLITNYVSSKTTDVFSASIGAAKFLVFKFYNKEVFPQFHETRV